jgi:transposase
VSAEQVALIARCAECEARWLPADKECWRSLYRGRAAVEREFGRLKNEYGLAPLRVRGLERVALHADLVMLARLSLALAQARTVPLAA